MRFCIAEHQTACRQSLLAALWLTAAPLVQAQAAALAAQVYFVTTHDIARSGRARLRPPAGLRPRAGIEVNVEPAIGWTNRRRALLVPTGSVRLPGAEDTEWLDGGLGDHLTSYGRRLRADNGQTTALDWLASGAMASHGTVCEPCNHQQKFPHPQWLLLHDLQGSTAIEAN